jgi:RNA polymerase sigma-70 factor (ECF subfamily)
LPLAGLALGRQGEFLPRCGLSNKRKTGPGMKNSGLIFRSCNFLVPCLVLMVKGGEKRMEGSELWRGKGLDEVVERYADMVFRIAFTHTKNRADAEDLFQEVFLKLCRSAPRFSSEEHRKAWLIRTTVHQSYNLLGSAWRRLVVLGEFERQAEQEEVGGEVLEALRALPLKARAVVELFYYEGMSIAEIAAALGLPGNTVKSRLLRARRALKKALSEGAFGDV